MRTLAIALLLAAAALAQSGELVDGKFVDKTWDFTYETPGLERTAANLAAQPNVLFEGRAAGGVQVEISVLEAPEQMPAKDWMGRQQELWKKAKREMADLETNAEGTPWLVFTETKLDVFTEQHGYAFFTRGTQCFLVHAYVADKTDKSAADIKKALLGLKLGESPGASLFALVIAQQTGRKVEDPWVLMQAGRAYGQTGNPNQKPNYAMARAMFKKAREGMKEDTFTNQELWMLYEFGGLSFLNEPGRDPKTAIEWHGKAEEAAKKLSDEDGRVDAQAMSAYNLACAYSLAGDVEKGFEALHRAFADKLAVDKGHLSSDPDINNLRKNQELWDKFWKEKVEGR